MAVRPDASTKSAAGTPLEEDLEQYGVWVKAEPRDIVEETETVSPSGPVSDELGDLDLPKEEDFLSEDEEKFLGSFDEIGIEEEKKDMEKEEAEAGMPDIDNLPPLEDFAVKEETMNDIEDLGASTIDISLDDLEKEAEAPSPIRPDADIDVSTIRGLPPEAEGEKEEDTASGPVIEDVSAEFLDFIEEGPEASASEAGEKAGAVPQAETPPTAAEEASEPDFEPIDMDLHFDDTLAPAATESGEAADAEPGFEEVSEFDDFLKDVPNRPGFDDVMAVEKDLSSEESVPEVAEPSIPGEQPAREGQSRGNDTEKANLSNELLLKIAEELSSIRGELVTLKGQISSFKKEESFVPTAAEEEAPAPASPAPNRSMGGFFDDEEDETIALTGDELDNILNTADFTEETAVEEGESPEPNIEEPSLDNILPESGDYGVPQAEGVEEEAPIEEIRLEPVTEEEPLPSFEEEEPEKKIEAFAEEGVSHLTQAPEDTSYLEEPLPNEEPLDLSEPGLAQESLAGAESLDLQLEEEEVEVPLDISEELPVVEPKPEAEELGDLTLGVKAEKDYLPTGVEEALPIETVPEFEESGFGEISLTVEDEQEVNEEVEEIKLAEEEGNVLPVEEMEPSLETELGEKTVKPAEPVSLHPDELPTSLDDSFFLSPIEESAGKEEKAPAEEMPEEEAAPKPSTMAAASPATPKAAAAVSKESKDDRLRGEIKSVLSYLDKLLESLPEDKIEEFARSEYFDTYKKLFEELGLV